MVSDMHAATAIDTMLDRTIALGYGDMGLRLRRRLPGWPADPPRMDGKVVVATGAASGIGLAACRGFAHLGASVRAVARDEGRADDAVTLIREAVPKADVRGLHCDVASLRALRSLAERLNAEEEQLDVLVNNAGTMPDHRERSPDGHEVMFATHVLAPFALTAWTADLLARSAPSRVINVSSGGMYGQSLPAGDFQSEDTRYSSKKLYARTKREEVVITELWAEKLAPRGIVVHAMHPGWVDTKGVRDWLPVFRALTGSIIRSPEEGADTVVWLGGSPEALRTTGRFWHDRRARPTHYRLGASDDDPRDRDRLWELCQSLIES
jgi:NAD(P)-dependent dehydrogenase (short-subunit alcohol dehydrogenase family)